MIRQWLLTISRDTLADREIEALIHDSFGTHAGRTQEFFYVIREAFVSMYANYDPFEEVLEAAKAVLSDEGIKRLPKLPAKGTLDLDVILDAPYAFA